MKTNLNYCIVLSAEQLIYLAGSKYGIDRMKILLQLIEATVLKETEYAIKGFSTTLQIGQAVLYPYTEMYIGVDAGWQPHRQSFLCSAERQA